MRNIALILLMLLPRPGQADDFGRIFHTPEERQGLDAEKQARRRHWQTFSGEIRRGNRPVVRWLDGQPEAAAMPVGSAQPGDRTASDGLREPLLPAQSIVVHRPAEAR